MMNSGFSCNSTCSSSASLGCKGKAEAVCLHCLRAQVRKLRVRSFIFFFFCRSRLSLFSPDCVVTCIGRWYPFASGDQYGWVSGGRVVAKSMMMMMMMIDMQCGCYIFVKRLSLFLPRLPSPTQKRRLRDPIPRFGRDYDKIRLNAHNQSPLLVVHCNILKPAMASFVGTGVVPQMLDTKSPLRKTICSPLIISFRKHHKLGSHCGGDERSSE